MKNKLSKSLLSALLVLPTLSIAQVCIGQSGTIGSIAVTASCTGASTGSTQATLQNNGSCTFSFSPAATPADFSVQTYAVNSNEVVSFAFNGTPYTLTAPELPPDYALSGSGATTTTFAGVVSTPYWTFANAPSSINSITISGTGGAFLAGVCGPVAPPPPTVAAPIPTLSEWAMIFMASLLAMFGIRRMRRNK